MSAQDLPLLAKYIDVLIVKAGKQEAAEDALLDRIERLLGIYALAFRQQFAAPDPEGTAE